MLTAADEAAAVALWQAASLTRPWNDAGADFRRAIRGPSSTVLGGELAGRLVATAMVGDDGHRGWIYYVAVCADARGAGLGRELMTACEDWLRSRGVAKLELMVRADNEDAQDFYRALGYRAEPVAVLSRRLGRSSSP